MFNITLGSFDQYDPVNCMLINL